MHRIVLASTSPYRKALMSQLGLPFETAQPLFNENKVKEELQLKSITPLDLAVSLAKGKALSLKDSQSVVIGGDQLVHLEGQTLGKPLTVEKAVQQLLFMSGKTHEIITAVCVVTPEKIIAFHDITRLSMKILSEKEIREYVAKDQPLDCAGSYKIEKNGRALFSAIASEDFSAIEGLPLLQLRKVLHTLGYETTSFA